MDKRVEEISYQRYLKPGTIVACSQGGVAFNEGPLNQLAAALARVRAALDALHHKATEPVNEPSAFYSGVRYAVREMRAALEGR